MAGRSRLQPPRKARAPRHLRHERRRHESVAASRRIRTATRRRRGRPSGNEIAFTSDRTGRPQIYIMNADGTGAASAADSGCRSRSRDLGAGAVQRDCVLPRETAPATTSRFTRSRLARRGRLPSARAANESAVVFAQRSASRVSRRREVPVSCRSTRLAAMATVCVRSLVLETTRHLTGRTEIPLEIRCVTH